MARALVQTTTNDNGRHTARCTVPGCTWTYGNTVKSDVAQHARWHRQQHQREGLT